MSAWSETLAQVERCPCGALVLRGWPKPHTCTAKPAVCAGCGQSPCACTDEAVDLMIEADALGLYSGGFDDSAEGWAS